MTDKEHIEFLDNILEYLNSCKCVAIGRDIFILIDKSPSANIVDLRGALHTLIDDKYIKKLAINDPYTNEQVDAYQILPKGSMFINNKGYKRKISSNKRKKYLVFSFKIIATLAFIVTIFYYSISSLKELGFFPKTNPPIINKISNEKKNKIDVVKKRKK